ncbi:MAG: hypothetical protein DKM50_02735 [Candidatus Margulisiibacteriota bacterium]|nr:MAG: hypothetical protein DKM50_02735 [Candidatus Margulisiibacteriota bacterium]HCT84145.1 hypothetical protein [Candidatus Margulisiibacteriota bacterium]HCY37400.1 hypothetical protein [Candidatus Margulisiibacteriota bacterium]
MLAGSTDVKEILKELVLLQEQHADFSLEQFQSATSAFQYCLLYSLISKYAPSCSRILDWGCGAGHCSYVLQRLGYFVHAYGFNSYPLISLLSKKEKFVFRKADHSSPVNIPFPENEFDLVASVGVLEHVRDLGGKEVLSLKEIARILRPGGHFICYHFPNKYSLFENITRKYRKNTFSHQYTYTKEDIVNLCRESGLLAVEIKMYNFLPRNIVGRFPGFLRHSALFNYIYNMIDNILTGLLGFLCQNYYFVAKKSQ